MDEKTPVCQEDGCKEASIKCIIPGGIDIDTHEEYPESYEYYCSEHAAKNGYCCCCGTFIAGWRDFSSYCEHCEGQVKDDIYDWDDEGDWELFF